MWDGVRNLTRPAPQVVLAGTSMSASIICPRIIEALIKARYVSLANSLTLLRDAAQDCRELLALIEIAEINLRDRSLKEVFESHAGDERREA